VIKDLKLAKKGVPIVTKWRANREKKKPASMGKETIRWAIMDAGD